MDAQPRSGVAGDEPRGPIRVLLVDDHQMFAKSLVRLLEDEADLEVVGVGASAADAVALVREHLPDVVLLDYGLPDGNGVGVASALRAVRADLPVVMLTGHADADVLAEAIGAGCCGFVTKDKAPEELIHAVRAARCGEAVISSGVLAGLLPRLREAESPPAVASLTRREREVLQLLAEGKATDVIAADLFVSRNTVRNHVQRLLAKLGAHSKLEAVAIGTRGGLVDPSLAPQ